jgi:hypothetical protein
MKQWVYVVVGLFLATTLLVTAVFVSNLMSFSKICGLLKSRLVYLYIKLHQMVFSGLLWNNRQKRRDSEASEDDIEIEEGEGSSETTPVEEV